MKFSKSFIIIISVISAPIIIIIGIILLLLIRPSSDWQYMKGIHTKALLQERWAVALGKYKDKNQLYPKANNLKELVSKLKLSPKEYRDKDYWNHEMIYKISQDQKEYSITSLGSDGVEGNKVEQVGAMYDMSTDIILKNGEIIQDFKKNIIKDWDKKSW